MGKDLLREGQHRLSRIQLFNWGTYDGYHDLPVTAGGFSSPAHRGRESPRCSTR